MAHLPDLNLPIVPNLPDLNLPADNLNLPPVAGANQGLQGFPIFPITTIPSLQGTTLVLLATPNNGVEPEAYGDEAKGQPWSLKMPSLQLLPRFNVKVLSTYNYRSKMGEGFIVEVGGSDVLSTLRFTISKAIREVPGFCCPKDYVFGSHQNSVVYDEGLTFSENRIGEGCKIVLRPKLDHNLEKKLAVFVSSSDGRMVPPQLLFVSPNDKVAELLQGYPAPGAVCVMPSGQEMSSMHRICDYEIRQGDHITVFALGPVTEAFDH